MRRAGRITAGQRQALETLLSHYGLPFSEEPLNFKRVFGQEAPVVLEIGFGNGQTLLEMAAQNPNQNFVGIEVHPPGIGALLLLLHKRRLIQPAFVKMLVEKLKVGGAVHLATDWTPYAEHMMCVLENEPGLANAAGKNQFSERSVSRSHTRFEQRGQRLGHRVFELVFGKI